MSIKNSGKKYGQKYKSFLVAQLLLKYTDEDHSLTVSDIKEHLSSYDIEAEHHSIVRDVKDLEELLNIEEEYDEDIIFDRAKLGYTINLGFKDRMRSFNVSSRPYDFEDIQLLSQCINSAKFITQNKAEELNEIVGTLCSDYQSNTLLKDPYLVGRTKTNNSKVIYWVNELNDAIKRKVKVAFNYYHYVLDKNVLKREQKYKDKYIVSPFKLIINNGNYYLLAYSDHYNKMVHYRLDRMGNVEIINEKRDGEDHFSKLNMSTYTQEVFNMFSGEKRRVHIQFINKLLDVVIDQFGLGENVTYSRYDDSHFVVSADIEVSDQFFAWISGFRNDAKIVAPIVVVESMKDYINSIANMYNK